MTDVGYHFRKEDNSHHIQLYKPHSAPQSLTTITSIIPSTIMESYSWALLVMASLVALGFLSKLFSFKHKFPPGPKPWPIIGNLNLIGSHPPQSLHNLAQKYGPIMQLKFGSFPVVVASSSEMAKQFLKTHDHVFASRPYTAAGKYTAYNYQNITWAPSGPYWRQGRKIFLSGVFNSKQLESYQYIRDEEMRDFLSRLCTLSGKPVMLKDHFFCLTLSIISRIVLSKKYVSESKNETSIVTPEEFQEMVDELFVLNGVFNIGDWIPWLDFLDLQGNVKRMKALKKKFDRFLDHVFDEHKAKREGVKDFVPKDTVDLLLGLIDDPNVNVKLTYDSIKALTQVIPLHF
jgi:cytochrome P450